jgi:hypothetical protein
MRTKKALLYVAGGLTGVVLAYACITNQLCAEALLVAALALLCAHTIKGRFDA